MPVINCEVNLISTWTNGCMNSSATVEKKFAITETKLYVPFVTLSTQDNANLLQQLKFGFKRTINWNKYESSVKSFGQNRYLNYLINPTFQGVYRHGRTSHSTYYLPKVEIRDYSVMIDGRNFFYQSIDSMTKTYENIRKIAIRQGIIIQLAVC